MADDDDQSSKTEEPSERKLKKLRDEANLPKSKEVNNLFMIFAMLLTIALAMPWQMRQLLDVYGTTIQAAGTARLTAAETIAPSMSFFLEQGIIAMLPTFLILMVFAYAGSVIQSGFVMSTKPIEPKLEKISLIKGLKRMFSMKSLAEFLKSIAKLIVIGAAIYGVFYMHQVELLSTLDKTVMEIVDTTQIVAIRMLLATLAIMVILAVADFMFQKAQYIKQNKMSFKDIKDEVKETEGDPYVKQRQRQIRNERAQQRMMQSVPESDVIITNPTHFSVALSYKPEEGMAAPTVVAKGVDFMAMRIRETANEHDIPLYEDPPLARNLYYNAEVDQEIPLELYEVTAKVIAYITSLKKKSA